MLLVSHGITLSMMHTKKIMKDVSRKQLNRRALYTGLQDDVKDAAHLRNVSTPSNLMDKWDKQLIREAYIDAIYKEAQMRTMCEIAAHPNLDHFQKRALRDQVPHVVKENKE